MLAELFATGRIVDAIVVFMLLELVILMMVRRKTRHGLSTAALLTNLVAGASLLMALRSALTSLPWQITAAWLAIALVAHIFDLKSRWTVHRGGT